MALLTVRHNIEVAHRIHDLPGKCTNIHGHSMWVEMSLQGRVVDGMVVDWNGQNLEFGEVKKTFRQFLDANYDHSLLLNIDDPFVAILQERTKVLAFMGRPSTEAIATAIYNHMNGVFRVVEKVTVHETHVNAVTYP